MIDVWLTCSSSSHMVFIKPTCSPAAAACLATKLSKVNSHAACLRAVLPHIWLSCVLTLGDLCPALIALQIWSHAPLMF